MTTDFQLREGQMFIFKNEHRDNDRQPTHRGQAKINDIEYWVSCWVKDGKNGKFFSCNVQMKEDQPDQTEPKNTDPTKIDDIPF